MAQTPKGHYINQNAKLYICTFPGKYERIWNTDMTGRDICTTCVFFPPGSILAGKHVMLEGGKGKCRCFELYGEQKPWGCFWFTSWIQNENKVEALNQHAVAVYMVKITITGTGTARDGLECEMVDHTRKLQDTRGYMVKFQQQHTVQGKHLKPQSAGTDSTRIPLVIAGTGDKDLDGKGVFAMTTAQNQPITASELENKTVTVQAEESYKVTVKHEQEVQGKHLKVESMAGDKEHALGGSQKGEVKWLEANYSIPLHLDINQFMEYYGDDTPTAPTALELHYP